MNTVYFQYYLWFIIRLLTPEDDDDEFEEEEHDDNCVFIQTENIDAMSFTIIQFKLNKNHYKVCKQLYSSRETLKEKLIT